MIKTMADLRSANIVRQAEWDKDDRISLSYRGNELAGEVGEACNVIKKLDRERMGIRGSRDTVEHLAEELADVVICADLIAMQEGIDLLGAAIPAKFNATSEKVGLTTRLVEGWQPISTAPPDGREYPIQICGGGFRRTAVAHWSGEIKDATHWSPMRPPVTP